MEKSTDIGFKIGLEFSTLQWFFAGLGVIIFLYFIYMLIANFHDVSISMRNVLRNKRRSLITLLAVSAAFMGSVLLGTYFLEMFNGLRESTIRSQTGHIQIQKTGFFKYGSSAPSEYVIDNYNEIIEELKKEEAIASNIKLYMKELQFNGIITSANSVENRSLNYLGRGVDVAQDKILSIYDKYIDGSALQEGESFQVILGVGLAEQLQIEIDEPVTLLSSTYDGMFNVLDGNVRGIVRSFSRDYSNVLVKTNLEFAQNMLGKDGVNKIIILLNDTLDTAFVYNHIKRIVNAHPEWDVVAYDWYTLTDYYKQVYTMFVAIYIVVSSLLLILIVFLVSNTMSMSIYERFNEFGTLRSIGLQKSNVVSLIFLEGIILGLLGGIVGAILARVTGDIISSMGIMLPPPPGSTTGYPLLLKVHFFEKSYATLLLVNGLSIISLTALSTIIPAVQATKMKIVDALRYN